MNEKRILWKRLIALISVVVATLISSNYSKALSIENNPMELTIEERLANVRKKIKIKVRENNINSQASPLYYIKLLNKQNNDGGETRENGNDWKNNWNNWDNWNNWRNNWRNNWHDWHDGPSSRNNSIDWKQLKH